MESDQEIRDPSDLRKWRTELPNMVDDADMDVYCFRLYVHYKRVGTCRESIATTARKCHMSQGKASQARMQLHELGWINLETYQTAKGPGYIVTVVDVWEENFAHYSTAKARKPNGPRLHHMNPCPCQGFMSRPRWVHQVK